jgi:hypothetical protein
VSSSPTRCARRTSCVPLVSTSASPEHLAQARTAGIGRVGRNQPWAMPRRDVVRRKPAQHYALCFSGFSFLFQFQKIVYSSKICRKYYITQKNTK